VQSTPITAPVTSEPLPTNYWSRPIFGENTNWYTISSNWLGSGAAVLSSGGAGYISSFSSNSVLELAPGDAVGPITSHVMWTMPIESGGIVGGNMFPSDTGVGYFEGSAYQQRFINPIIIGGYLYYTAPSSFTGPTSGPTVAVNLQTGQVLWSSTTVPALSFGYIYDLWDPDQHGVYPPVLVATAGGGLTGIPATWELFDAYTGDSLFNVTGVPGFAAQTGQTVNGQPAVALTNGVAAGPAGEQLRYVLANAGTAAAPNWYLSEWNMSKLWIYDINPYTGGGSLSPSIINATNGVLVPILPIPITGETGTTPAGGSVFVPYGSTLTVSGSVGIAEGLLASSANPTYTYDWNVSVPWLNTMPLQATLNSVTGKLALPAEQGTNTGFLAAGGTNPVTIVAAITGDLMLCRNGSLPVGFANTQAGYPQLPFTYFAVNLNASRGALGSILWMQTYNPPAGNLTVVQGDVDPVTGIFVLSYAETMQWVGYSLTSGAQIWGPTPTETAFDYYGNQIYPYLSGQIAYGKLYVSSFGGVCYCYNDLTGAIEWTWGNGAPGSDNSTFAGTTTPYGVYPTFINAIGNGVVYLVTSEHTITDPIYKGATLEDLNATTGQEILGTVLLDYTGEFRSQSFAIADGYSTVFNGYDDQIYSLGQGPSATTVQAPQPIVTAGNSALLQGTVMDTSAGTQQSTVKADFPSGVPCASDASMTSWMEYVYQQQAEPTNFTGVTVTLTAIDPNGNFVTLGSATTDSKGLYSLQWTAPNVPGKYTVTATFAGTNGYWGSSAQTAMIVQAPSATSAPTAAPVSGLATASDLTYGIVAVIIVIIIAVAIVGLLLLRKKP